MISETEKREEIFNLVKGVKSRDGKTSLHEHLMKLYETKMEVNDDAKFLDLIEDISLRIKTNGSYFEEDKARAALLNYLAEFEKNCIPKKSLLGPLIKKVEGSEPEVITTVNFVPDYHNIFKTLEWVGLSVGEKESYLVTNSLRNLVSNKNLANGITFWGKIYGRERDYYVAEAVGVEANSETQPSEPDFEKRNEDGINKSTFFVTNDLTGDWVELPDVKPAHIKAARKIRYIFTGDLSRKIVTNPHFPGEEKDLLRCQIARISHGTKIEPSVSHYIVSDAESPFKSLEKNPDETKVKPMKLNDYLSISNWIHFPPNILNQGRVSHYIDYPPEVPSQEDYRMAEMKKDPFGPRIRPLSEDSVLPSAIPNIKLPPWRIHYMYEDKIYINPGIKLTDNPEEEQKDNTANYLVICLKSLRWPGAHTVRSKSENYFFYFGWGQKFADYTLGDKFVYQDFPAIAKDIEDFVDCPEPNSPPHEEANLVDDGKKNNDDDN